MTSELKLNDEEGRIRALERYQILDTESERPFENIVSTVKQILKVPISAVSLVDVERQWFKAYRGLGVCETNRDISFCTHTIGRKDCLIVRNALEHPLFANNPLVLGAPHIRAYAGVPLRSPDGYQIGSLCAIDIEKREFPDHEIDVLESFSKLVVEELELRLRASSDVLTGALTRRAWLNELENEFSRCQRTKSAFSIAMFDIDHFKSVNDAHGHCIGDEVIRAVVSSSQKTLRKGQKIGRLGGEEFGILLPECDLNGAQKAAERCRSAIEDLDIKTPDGNHLCVTASFGISEYEESLRGPKELISFTDDALYRAKENGRNRVEACQIASSNEWELTQASNSQPA